MDRGGDAEHDECREPCRGGEDGVEIEHEVVPSYMPTMHYIWGPVKS